MYALARLLFQATSRIRRRSSRIARVNLFDVNAATRTRTFGILSSRLTFPELRFMYRGAFLKVSHSDFHYPSIIRINEDN